MPNGCTSKEIQFNSMESYDSSLPQKKTLMYQDANTSYSWVRSQYLSLRGYKWVSTNVNYLKLSNNAISWKTCWVRAVKILVHTLWLTEFCRMLKIESDVNENFST